MAGDVWFLHTRVSVRVACDESGDDISVLEHLAPFGDSPPLHVHVREDEIFHLLEGEIAFRIGHQDRSASAGTTLLAPKGVPHTYRVLSKEGARWLTVTSGRDFERFVRALGREAETEGLPPPAAPPSPEDIERLAAAARGHGIEIVGPPLSA